MYTATNNMILGSVDRSKKESMVKCACPYDVAVFMHLTKTGRTVSVCA